jgi:arginyl-tRNA synthetase
MDGPRIQTCRVSWSNRRAMPRMATNAAMVLAKEARAKPRDLAEQIAAKLRADDLIASADVAGPGFINLTLQARVWSEALRTVLREGDRYGRSDIGAAEKVNVEYVSANPTGPMHVGHCRGAVFGDALASLLQFAGYDVTREYYINDAGVQVDVLARSAFLRYREALGENIGAIPEGLYPGDYLKPVGEALAAEHGDKLLAMAAGSARHGRGDDDGHDQKRSRRPQHQTRRVLLRTFADRNHK